MKKSLALFVLTLLFATNAFALWNVGVIGGAKVNSVAGLSIDFTKGSLSSACSGVSGGCSFSRSSDGTYFDSSGVMQTAAADVPRFDCDPASGAARGILIEPSATNYATHSMFDATWNTFSGETQTLNYATGIDGQTDAARLTIPSHSSSQISRNNLTSSGGLYIESVYVKATSSAPQYIGLFWYWGGAFGYFGSYGSKCNLFHSAFVQLYSTRRIV